MSRRQVRQLDGATFGERLRNARSHRELTQESVARAVDVPLRKYQRWEADDVEPRGSDVMALARALDVSVGALFPEPEAKAA